MRYAHRSRLLFLGLLLTNCAHQPEMGWIRIDGKAVVPIQFEADQTSCRGEREKAALTEREHKIYFGEHPLTTVFNGCMAGKGYVLRQAP